MVVCDYNENDSAPSAQTERRGGAGPVGGLLGGKDPTGRFVSHNVGNLFLWSLGFRFLFLAS